MNQPKKLHEIISDAMEITSALIESGGEVTPEINERIQCNEVALASKVDSYVMVIERLSREEEYWIAKAKEFSDIANGIADARNKLKTNIKNAMKAMDVDEIKGMDYRYKLTKSRPRLDIDERELPQQYTIVEIKPDKEKIKAALADGIEVPGAKLIETTYLKPYKNRKVE